MTNGPFTHCNKEVLRNSEHIADAATNQLANDIARALNILWDIREGGQLEAEHEAMEPRFELLNDCPVMPEIRNTSHGIRQEGDEYACSCGARWDVKDGEEHP